MTRSQRIAQALEKDPPEGFKDRFSAEGWLPLVEAVLAADASDTTAEPTGEWRTTAEWDWVQTADDDDLHAPASIENDADVDWFGEGATECGRRGTLTIPGLFSRMGAARCERCCAATGMPTGPQSPKNVEECRPVVEARLRALLEATRAPFPEGEADG